MKDNEVSFLFKDDKETIFKSKNRVIKYFNNNPQISLKDKIKFVNKLYPMASPETVIYIVRECENV